MGSSLKNTEFLIASRLRDAARGNADALYDLGVCYSTGASGVAVDLIEAHKFFNLAAVSGVHAAAHARSDVAEDMSAREIAAAQAAARAWLGTMQRRAA